MAVEELETKPLKSSGFEQECVDYHNHFRKLLGLENLTLNQTLVNEALEYAAYLQQNDKFEHSDVPEGENLYFSFNQGIGCKEPILRFFQEYRQYFGKLSHSTGHFTQLIWPRTRMVGCAQKLKGSKRTVVCRYYPAGNIMGMDLNVMIQNTSFY